MVAFNLPLVFDQSELPILNIAGGNRGRICTIVIKRECFIPSDTTENDSYTAIATKLQNKARHCLRRKALEKGGAFVVVEDETIDVTRYIAFSGENGGVIGVTFTFSVWVSITGSVY